MSRDRKELSNSIFSQPWWLDAVAPGQWDEVVVNDSEQVVARMPFVIRKRLGLTFLTMPHLTQSLGPSFLEREAKYAKRLAREKDLMTRLIEKLPKHDWFNQRFHCSVTNWLPFHWRGFEQTTRYTYRLGNLSDLDGIWSGFLTNIRTDIRKAEKRVAVRTDLGVEKFLDVNEMTFKRQGRELPYSRDLVKRIDEACGNRDCRKIFFAEDSKGRVHASVYIVWDERAAYYLMGGSDPELRNSGATSLAIWSAIRFAVNVTNTFDFEGSIVERIERFFRAFGGQQVPYFHVTKQSRRMRALMSAKSFVEAVLGTERPR